jgi:hypothetical protein
MSAPHRIRRQIWRVRAGSAEEAFALRGALREACNGVLLPAFERAFDEAIPDDRVVRLPRLELKLRVASLHELAEVLPAAIAEAVGREIATVAEVGAGAARPAPAPHPPSPDRRDVVRPVPAVEDALSTLLHFLRAGTLPWAAAGRPVEEVRRELRAAAKTAPERVAAAARGAADREIFWIRLLALLEPEEDRAVVEALSDTLPPPWRPVLLRLVAPTPPAVPRYLRLRLAAALLADAQAGGGGAAVAAVLADAARAPGGMRDEMAALLAAIPGLAGLAELRGARGGDRDAGVAPAPAAAERPAVLPPPEPSPQPLPLEEPDDIGLAVASAGLVLLHPYLRPLLEHTGLAADGRISTPALPRAAALLHHLATGREEVQEFELGVAKVLLGLAPETPLPLAEGLLRPDDMAESEALLRAAIAHWGVLKSTSPAGLRSAFLERRGLLRREEGGWRLRVEPAPYDMLLDRLPWSIGVVKLPWMPEPLFTEWPTP